MTTYATRALIAMPLCPWRSASRPQTGASRPASSGATPISTPAHDAAALGVAHPELGDVERQERQHEGEAREDGEHHRHRHRAGCAGRPRRPRSREQPHLADAPAGRGARGAARVRPLEPSRRATSAARPSSRTRGGARESHHVAPVHALAPAGAERLAGRLLRRDREGDARRRARRARRAARPAPPGPSAWRRSARRSARAHARRARFDEVEADADQHVRRLAIVPTIARAPAPPGAAARVTPRTPARAYNRSSSRGGHDAIGPRRGSHARPRCCWPSVASAQGIGDAAGPGEAEGGRPARRPRSPPRCSPSRTSEARTPGDGRRAGAGGWQGERRRAEQAGRGERQAEDRGASCEAEAEKERQKVVDDWRTKLDEARQQEQQLRELIDRLQPDLNDTSGRTRAGRARRVETLEEHAEEAGRSPGAARGARGAGPPRRLPLSRRRQA